MNLILPIAGESSRFPNMRPKWMLTHPSGKLMLLESISGLNVEDFDSVYAVALQHHEDKYSFSAGLTKAFKEIYPNIDFNLILLGSPTRSQPETVYQAIKLANITGAICVKDCDNFFKIDVKPLNFISFSSLENNQSINASNKSYIEINEHGLITNIVEKKVISPYFCTGAYGFADATTYVKYYERCNDIENLYISHIMFSMLLDDISIVHVESKEYKDWGTIEDWQKYTRSYKTLFVDIDGVLVENSSKYFSPSWGESGPLEENVKTINDLFDSGKGQIILTTARAEEYRDKTLKQLNKIGLRYHKIVFGLMHAQRIVINDFSATNPYPSCLSLNVERNSQTLKRML